MPITAAGQQAVKNGVMGLICRRVKMSKFLLLTVCAFGLLFSSALAQAQCTYRMNDVGRFHGYLSGPCNGSALGMAGAYPSHSNSAVQAHPTRYTPKASARQQIAQGWQGNPSSQAVDDKEMTL